MASVGRLVSIVQESFRKSFCLYLSWDDVVRVLRQKDGFSECLLCYVTPTVEAVFGIKKNAKGFNVEVYSNSSKSLSFLVEEYVTSRLKISHATPITLRTVLQDFRQNNPILPNSDDQLLQLLAASIKRILQVTKTKEAPFVWPIAFKTHLSTVRPITRKTYQASLNVALENSLKDVAYLPPNPLSQIEENKMNIRISNLMKAIEGKEKKESSGGGKSLVTPIDETDDNASCNPLPSESEDEEVDSMDDSNLLIPTASIPTDRKSVV